MMVCGNIVTPVLYNKRSNIILFAYLTVIILKIKLVTLINNQSRKITK